mmetsp:Transcript_23157/g.34187  ORF Transcript_23157/g.34187 Transcript_23157/m.34187 type:complete len:150 (-) Transcript_23157:414-863(-)
MFRLLAIISLGVYATAFVPATLQTRPLTARQVLLSEEETEKIVQSGANCLESECSIDDVASLLWDLKDQEEILSARLASITSMVEGLEIANKKTKVEERDEVKMFVRDLLRVFSNEKPMFPPTGLSFDKGPFDAYDVLEPKKWTPAAEE